MKYIATMVVGLLLVPGASFAATPEEQYQSLVSQLIALLTEQVHQLQAQLALLQEQKVDNSPVLGATIATATQTPMTKTLVRGSAHKENGTVLVNGSITGFTGNPEVTAVLLVSNKVEGTDRYTDPVTAENLTVLTEVDGDTLNFSFNYDDSVPNEKYYFKLKVVSGGDFKEENLGTGPFQFVI